MRVLVSLCNVGDERPSLVVLDTASGDVAPLPVTCGSGATGLCAVGDEILAACQTPDASVRVLDARTLDVRIEAPLPGAHDVHSLVAWDGGLAVASSGTDEIVWYRYDGSRFTDRTVLWSGGTGDGDVLHVNALSVHRGSLLGCAFGPRRSKSDLWSDARGGFVFEVSGGRVVLAELRHPHSLVSLDDELYLCESAPRLFRSLDRPIAALDGYTRGAVPLGRARVLVGTSVGRVRSRSSGQLLNPADGGDRAGTCAVHDVGLDGSVRESISLASYGAEIYDLLALS